MKASIAFFLFFTSFCSYVGGYEKVQKYRKFPKNFKFGTATASYQIEGAWNADDKGENIWDRLTHTNPEFITDQSNGDIACDSYHNYKRDIEMLKELGVDYYRFSLSWSRILPNGFANKVSKAGIRYYNRLIDALLAANIEPMVTLYHWDLPQPLQDLGGWPNREMVEFYEDFARIAFDNFGDRVKMWITFNEPIEICEDGYGEGAKAPGITFSGIADYQCAHTLLLAHARVFHIYNSTYRAKQQGKIGITLNMSWTEPATNATEDIEAAERAFQFNLGWYANPIFSKEGDYPRVMRERIDARSKEQGYPRSRLPKFTKEEVESLKGSADFFGLNHYTTKLLSDSSKSDNPSQALFYGDMGVTETIDPAWIKSASSWLYVVPWGFTKILKSIKEKYDNPPVIITENGYSTHEGLNDKIRILYLEEYLNAMLDAMEDGCDVLGYTYWSLMDNFEWKSGYTERFGVYEVDFKGPERKRSMRDSAFVFKNILKARKLIVI